MPDLEETPAQPSQPEINPGSPHRTDPQHNPAPSDPTPPAETPSTPSTPPTA